MIKKLFFVSAALLLAATAGQAQSTNRLHFPVAGFSIASLEAPPKQKDAQQPVLLMFLPASEGFSPNVNILIQPHEGTIEEYLALTLNQFKSAGLKVITQKTVGKGAVTIEYSGATEGQAMHCYARAEKSGGKVYLITATSTEGQWSTTATPLKACVDSFRLDGK